MSRRAAVLGSPIAHSRSPVLHNTAYRELGLAWAYQAIDVRPEDLGTFLAGLDETWVGLSLTMPLKVDILPFLDEVSAIAQQAQAVNTVTMRDGRRVGDNTDVPALIGLITERLQDRELGVEAVVLGAGATARSAVVALHACGVDRVICWARRLDAAQTLAEFARACGMAATAVDGAPRSELLDCGIVISALPGDAAQPWSHVAQSPPGVLVDVSYDPWPPPLTEVWPAEHVITGLDLLMEQAALQIEHWTGRVAPRAAMQAALLSTVTETRLDSPD